MLPRLPTLSRRATGMGWPRPNHNRAGLLAGSQDLASLLLK
jgi:hypothetical protein